MDFIIAIIAIVALVIAVSLQSDVKMLKAENKRLKEMVQQLMNRGMPPKPQDVVPQVQQQTQPVVPAVVTPQKPVVHKEPKPQKNMENVFGKNVIGVVASILMFIGVFAFGTLVLTSMPDIAKVIGMFLLSAGVLVFGMFLNKKNPTVFSTIVAGCGTGLFFISIFLTHLYYHMIGDIATFTLIFLWAVGVSALSKKCKMPSLSYVALVGCIVSSILGQVYVVEQHMFVEITIYHFLTFLLLIIANKENHILFKIASYTSITLNTALGVIINAYSIDNNQESWLVLCFLLCTYNLAIGILAYRDEHGDASVNDVLGFIAYAVNVIINALVPLSALVTMSDMEAVNTLVPIDWAAVHMKESILFTFGTLLVLAVTYAAQYFCIKDTKKRTKLFLISEIIMALIILLEPISLANSGDLGFLLVFPVANLILAHKSKEKYTKDVLYWSGFGMLLVDMLTSHACLYDFTGWCIVYSVALLILSCAYMFERYGFIMKFPFLQTAIINGHLLFTLLNACNDNWPVALIIVVLLNMGWSALVQWSTHPPKVSRILTEITESFLAFVVFWLVLDDKEIYPVGCYLLSVLLIPFMLTRLKSIMQTKDPFMSVWYGIKFTFYTFGTLEMFTGFTDQQFIVSVVLMILASACIAFGFWKDMKALRIYGLALVMSSVAKMVILDVWNQESMIRVLSLIAGALICFGISAVYTKIEQRNQLTE